MSSVQQLRRILFFSSGSSLHIKHFQTTTFNLRSAKILLLPSKCEFFFYPFSIAPHLVIALPTLRQQKSSLLISLLQLLYEFCMVLYCFPYSYRYANYCDIKSCRSFTLLKAFAKSNINLIAIAFKSEKERQLSLSRQLEER